MLPPRHASAVGKALKRLTDLMRGSRPCAQHTPVATCSKGYGSDPSGYSALPSSCGPRGSAVCKASASACAAEAGVASDDP